MREAGLRDAPAIIFLLGGLSGRMGQPLELRLPDFYCLAPDLPEQGRSIAVHSFTLADMVARVTAIIDERIPQVGHVWNRQALDLFTDTMHAWASDQALPPLLRAL